MGGRRRRQPEEQLELARGAGRSQSSQRLAREGLVVGCHGDSAGASGQPLNERHETCPGVSLGLLGIGLSLFHLVSLLLVLGIGLNYSLFFSQAEPGTDSEQGTSLALSVCFLTTFAAFGCLATSRIPVLSVIGLTVTLGCALSLLNAMILGGATLRAREAR